MSKKKPPTTAGENMKRSNYFMEQWQIAGLDAVSARTGKKPATLVRKSVTSLLARHGIKPPAIPS